MRVSLSWLREFTPVEGDAAAIADALNQIGLIVDAVDEPGREIAGVVAARVLEVADHPDADKLTLVDIDHGAGQTRVVCGARNLGSGDVVPYAPPGATLPGGFILEKRKIRGQVSDGMLCSARELGIGEDHEGILHLDASAELGADAREVLGLDDVVFELDITPNRPDAMSIVGVARDLAALTGAPFEVPEPSVTGGGRAAAEECTVEIVDLDRCPRYLAMTGSVEMGTSPEWLRGRLTLAGMRPISSVVDVTNYVLLERGQPLHAFDHDRLGGGGIRVRVARDGERMTTLDGVEREFTAEDLLICDADDVPHAIAGVMGGLHSEVGTATTRLLLESAYFSPAGILQTSKRLGLRSEASARFERGVDPNGIEVSARRAWELFEQVAEGTAGSGAVDEYPRPVEREQIALRPRRVNEVLGTELKASEITGYLEALEMEVDGDDPRLTVSVPTFRPDLAREIDLVEEVARLHGYNNVERTVPRPAAQVGALTPDQRRRRVAFDALVGAGLDEAMTLSLVAPSDLEAAGYPAVGIEVENPLRSEESLLRPAVLPGLLRSVAFNASHGIADTGLFEVGTVFQAPRDGEVLPDEHEHLAVTLSGVRARHPHEPDRPVDVHDAVGVVEIVVEALELDAWQLDPAPRPGFHPGRCAVLYVDGEEAGAVGEISPQVIDALELPEPTVGLEVDLGRLIRARRRERWYRPPSRFPSSSIDLAFVVERSVPAAVVRTTLVDAGGDLLERVELFDVFESETLGPDRVSLAYRLRFRAGDRTLTDEEVGELRQQCIDAVSRSHGAELRG